MGEAPDGAFASPTVFYEVTLRVDYEALLSAWRQQLGSHDLERLEALRLVRDRRDYLAAHVLRHKVAGAGMGRSSLTHCEGFVAVAFSGDPAAPIGVDAEPANAEARLATMADVFSSPAEREGLGLVQLWTVKEAALKERGVGLIEAGGVDALRRIACRRGRSVDEWVTIALRNVVGDDRQVAWTRRVGGHVLSVVVGTQMMAAPRLTRLAIQ